MAGNFDGTNLSTLNANVTTHSSTLKSLCKSPQQQRQLISASEWFFGSYKSDLIKFFPAILKKFYEDDIVEEEVFLEWYQDSLRNVDTIPLLKDDTLEALRNAALPFYEWIQADDESSDDEDAEEDD